MPARLIGLCLLALVAALGCAQAQDQPQPLIVRERVTFPSLDGMTTLVASLLRPREPTLQPALVLLHGCSGLQVGGRIFPIYRSWGRLLAAAGYVVLADRPKDAYAALQYLQAQPFVRPDRIGVIGWSQGGATILLALRADSRARPEGLKHDFRSAIAFYPGACNERLQSRPFYDSEPQRWTGAIPMLVLLGGADNWTPAPPCEAFLAGAKARGAPIELEVYLGAPHLFDAPELTQRELVAYRLPNGTAPLVGTDQAARTDALARVPEFLKRHLVD